MPASTPSLPPRAASIRFFEQVQTVDGMLDPTAGYLSALLMLHQNAIGVTGDACEIGVFKGKYFLAVATCLKPGEKTFAVDIFDDQHSNLDEAGYRELDVRLESVFDDFSANIARFLPPGTCEILRQSSLDLTAEKLLARGGPFRFFSVDGGHSRDVVAHDLRIADKCISDDGIISIDDAFNVQWTGVITAFFEYIQQSNMVPFAVIPNKLLCCRPDKAEAYKAFLRTAGARSLSRQDMELSNSLVDLHAAAITQDEFAAAAGAMD